MSKKNLIRELDTRSSFRKSESRSQVLTEFSYLGEHGGWVVVPAGDVPGDLPPSQLRYAQHMGWISVTAAELPVTLPDADEPKEEDHGPEIDG